MTNMERNLKYITKDIHTIVLFIYLLDQREKLKLVMLIKTTLLIYVCLIRASWNRAITLKKYFNYEEHISNMILLTGRNQLKFLK